MARRTRGALTATGLGPCRSARRDGTDATMFDLLPIDVDALLGGRVESTRLEFKASWSEPTKWQLLKSICAFANDLYNLNGGYILIGVAERDGIALRPVEAGLPPGELDAIQKQVRGLCNRLDPPYQPLMAPALVDGSHVLVIHAPASETRPHHAPDGPKGEKVAYVRIGSETVKANQEPLRTQLYQQTARVPFDDRRADDATVQDLRENRVREFLRDVQSDLQREDDAATIYQAMQLLRPVNGHHVPRNVALLFFSDNPRQWFPGALIDVVRFGADDGTTLEERRFSGPIHEQLRQCLTYLEGFSVRHLRKTPRQVEARGFVSYPLLALREALVNAVYHRSYEPAVPDPIKVYLFADRIEVISYPGPAPGLDPEDFEGGRVRSIAARNRRIGELLKELRLAEERSTGVPKIYRSMAENGSPPPRFDFDRTRSYFRVTLPAHPEYVTVEALTEAAYLETTGDHGGAVQRLRDAFASHPDSAVLAVALIKLLGRRGRLDDARAMPSAFTGDEAGRARVTMTLAEVVLEHGGDPEEARRLIDGISTDVLMASDAMDAAIVARRAGRREAAHAFFVRAGALVESEAQMLHEFAQTKMDLARAMSRDRARWTMAEREARGMLLREAEGMLERVIQMDGSRERHAWAWFNLAWVRRQLRAPKHMQRVAIENAVRLMPESSRFRAELERLQRSGE